MAAGDIVNLASINEEVTASCTLGTTVYLGTAQGNIYRLTISGPSLNTTPLANVGSKILSMCMYGTLLYVTKAGLGSNGYDVVSVAVS